MPNRVLLAHGDPVVQELTARALGRLAVTLDIVPDPADAVSRIAGEPYNVIALQRDEEVIAAIAASAGQRPVVIVTTEDGRDLNPDGVSLVVPEPYDPHILVGVILACVTPASASPGDDALTENLLKDA